MDLEELQRHDVRQPVYPWKPIQWSTIPTAEERIELTQSRVSFLYQLDKIRAEAEFQEMRKLELERETKQVVERIRQRERQEGKGKENIGPKRRLEADDNDDNGMNTLRDGESGDFLEGAELKQRRLFEGPKILYPAFSTLHSPTCSAGLHRTLLDSVDSAGLDRTPTLSHIVTCWIRRSPPESTGIKK